MGVRGLTSYIHEHLDSTLEWHKLRRRKVIIDGNNLAHVLYSECAGVNSAFGGDYDKYANFIRLYFGRLQSCEVTSIVVMDGGQPLDQKKVATVMSRIQDQIDMCLNVHPNNQNRMKIFPPMGRQVFVSTLKSMGIVVLQTDFEADEEIAVLAKKLGYTVLSNDSDFYVSDVPFILLESINYKDVCRKKGKKSGENYDFLPCYKFNVQKFCNITKLDRFQLPILATVLGNDYIPSNVFSEFYDHIETSKRGKGFTRRHIIVRDVMKWLSSRKDMSVEETLQSIVQHAPGKRRNLMKRMRAIVRTYMCTETNLLDCLPQDVCTGGIPNLEDVESTSGDSQKNIGQQQPVTDKKSNEIETSLVLKTGQKPPIWFVKAYREHNIAHEVADILTHSYFISPPQVEDKNSDSAYLFMKPIVRSICILLTKGACEDRKNHIEKNQGNQQGKDITSEKQYTDINAAGGDDYDDEEEEEEEDSKVEDNDDPSLEYSDEDKANIHIAGKEAKRMMNKSIFKWYIRKANKISIRRLGFSQQIGDTLPSLKEMDLLSASEKKVLFYSILNADNEFEDLDLPENLELIFLFIVYWFRNSPLQLTNNHVMTVLLCLFMYYIIDGKIGWLRSKDSFKNVASCQLKVKELVEDKEYQNPSATVRDLLNRVSYEECLVAGHNLSVYHHLNEDVTRANFNRKTVHAFSEYQTCIYFMQLLNNLLSSPFPSLSIEYLWGGTFSYNVLEALKTKSKPLKIVRTRLGKGTCLARLYAALYTRLARMLCLRDDENSDEDMSHNEKRQQHGRHERRKKEIKAAKTEKKNDQEVTSKSSRKKKKRNKTKKVETGNELSPTQENDASEAAKKEINLDNQFSELEIQ